MLGDKKDDFYNARLVATAKLHLSTVVAGGQSPVFFETMNEIIKRNVHKGYKTLKGKDIKLSGIKDFFYNFHYGLGVRNLPEFCSNCAKLEATDKTAEKSVRKFIDWLRTQDEVFTFPDAYWEFRRLQISIAQMNGSREKKNMYWRMLKTMYDTGPDILKYIGPSKKYRSIVDAYQAEGYVEKVRVLTPIKLHRCPTHQEVEQLARTLNARLDKLKNRVLIAKLIEIYKINEAIEKHLARGSSADDDAEI